MRTERTRFLKALEKINHLKDVAAIKITLPQDEFTCMDLLNRMVMDFKINHVFSVAPESEWHKLYPNVNREKTSFSRILTGYLDEVLVARWKDRSVWQRRPIDIGYRTESTARWGRFNIIKATIADIFLKKANEFNLTVDIKVGQKHFYQGDEWLEFLSRCRYTLGIEGGSRLLDWNGSIWYSVNAFLKKYPSATIDDLSKNCVPIEKEGEINVVAISPRHLEACMTRTVQILVEGQYNGVLKPNEHYIPLRSDFSNIDQVMSQLSDESQRNRIAKAAFEDIVMSQRYTYRSLINRILRETKIESLSSQPKFTFNLWLCYKLNTLYFSMNIVGIWLVSRLRDLMNLTPRKQNGNSPVIPPQVSGGLK